MYVDNLCGYHDVLIHTKYNNCFFFCLQCGFFKRNRPSSAPEKQPLTNRNGQAEHYQTGDEAL